MTSINLETMREGEKPFHDVTYQGMSPTDWPVYYVSAKEGSTGYISRKPSRKRLLHVGVASCIILLFVLNIAQLLYTYSVEKRLEEYTLSMEKHFEERVERAVQRRIAELFPNGLDISSVPLVDESGVERPPLTPEFNRSKRKAGSSTDSGKKKERKKNRKRRRGKNRCRKKCEYPCTNTSTTFCTCHQKHHIAMGVEFCKALMGLGEDNMNESRRSQSQSVFLHMPGTDDPVKYEGGSNFKWKKPEDRGSAVYFDLLPSPITEISKVGIKFPGLYLVYSQVTVAGTDSTSMPHSCAHQTIRRRAGTNTDEVILKSRVTQYNLGQSYAMEGDNSLHPIDSALQMGVFRLLSDDELRVTYSEGCSHVNFAINSKDAYFGMVKIGD